MGKVQTSPEHKLTYSNYMYYLNTLYSASTMKLSPIQQCWLVHGKWHQAEVIQYD